MTVSTHKTESGIITHIQYELTTDEVTFPLHFTFVGQTHREIDDKLRKFIEETEAVLSEVRAKLEP